MYTYIIVLKNNCNIKRILKLLESIGMCNIHYTRLPLTKATTILIKTIIGIQNRK